MGTIPTAVDITTTGTIIVGHTMATGRILVPITAITHTVVPTTAITTMITITADLPTDATTMADVITTITDHTTVQEPAFTSA